MDESSKLSPFVAMIMSSMILSGTMNTLNDKFQSQQYVVEGGVHKYFYHPYIQNVILFISLVFAFPVGYLIKKIRAEDDTQNGQIQVKPFIGKKFKPLRMLVSATCDTIAALLQGIAINFVPASSYQMMRGGTIATTFLFSYLYLKMKMRKHHIVGVILAILGIMVIGSNSLIFSASSSKVQNSDLEIIGYLLIIMSLFFHGFAHVYDENLLRTYAVEPIQMIGYTGLFGIIINVAITVAASNIHCPFGVDACAYNSSGSPFLDRPEMYFKQLGENTPLLVLCAVEVVTIFIVNISGISITKYVNAIARAICDVTRSIFVWSFGIIITVTVGVDEENYKWERTQVGAILIQILGFVLLVFGNLVYNKILALPGKDDKEIIKDQQDYQPPFFWPLADDSS